MMSKQGFFFEVDQLAEIIRSVDGNHSLGAGALAEAIIEKLQASQPNELKRLELECASARAMGYSDILDALNDLERLKAQQGSVAGATKLYECNECGHLYQAPVSRCDCMPVTQKFKTWLAWPESAGAPQPDVQGEPVLDAPFGGILYLQVDGKPDQWCRINPCKLYAAPQPIEQQAPEQKSSAPLNECSTCQGHGGVETPGYPRDGRIHVCRKCDGSGEVSSIAEHQPAPDVAGLESALKSMVSGYMRLLQSGYDRITDLGGDCDPVDVMERDDAYLREARATLAAIAKATGGKI